MSFVSGDDSGRKTLGFFSAKGPKSTSFFFFLKRFFFGIFFFFFQKKVDFSDFWEW